MILRRRNTAFPGLMIAFVASGVALVGPVLLGGLGLVILVYFLIQWPDDAFGPSRVLRWTMAVFGSHLAFGLLVTSSNTLRGYLGPDSFFYHAQATNLLSHWTEGFPMPHLPSGKEGYFFLLAGTYWIFGTHFAAGVAVNAALGAALVPVLSDVTERLFGSASARYVGPLILLFPGFLLWTSQLLREASVLFLIAVALNCAIRLADRFSLASTLCLAASLTLLFSFRGYLALVIAAGVLGGIALGGRRLVSGVGTGLVALSLVGTVILAFGIGYSGYKTAVNINLVQANAVRHGLSTSASGFASDVNIATPARAIYYLPIAMLSFSAGPFPWQIHGLRQLPALPEVLVWWYLLPSLWRGFKAGRRQVKNRVMALGIPLLTTTPVLALTVGNYGILERERTQIVIMAVPFIALGLATRKVESLERAKAEQEATEEKRVRYAALRKGIAGSGTGS